MQEIFWEKYFRMKSLKMKSFVVEKFGMIFVGPLFEVHSKKLM